MPGRLLIVRIFVARFTLSAAVVPVVPSMVLTRFGFARITSMSKPVIVSVPRSFDFVSTPPRARVRLAFTPE